MSLKFLIPLVLSSSLSEGANILAILPMPSYSHQIAYRHIWKELSLRGHNVTSITTDPLSDPKLTNLTEIDLKWTYIIMRNTIKLIQKKEISIWGLPVQENILFEEISKALLSDNRVQDLIHGEYHFDIVLTEFFFPELLAFADIFNSSKIIFSSLDSNAIVHNAVGNPINPVLYPDFRWNFYRNLNFKERVMSTIFTLYYIYFYHNTLFPGRDELIKQYFHTHRKTQELLNDVDMLLLNVNPILNPIRALGPSTITIGGFRPTSSRHLPQNISKFLDSATDGFIYFSLGSNVQSKDLPKQSLEAIIETLQELPYKVLWKFEADELPNKPKNVKLIKWAPQEAVLSHPNVKLFVMQGGLQSMEEGLYSEVPFVVIPFFGDQDQNAKIMESKGFAVVVNNTPWIKKTELKDAILEVINNPKYRNNAKRIKQLILDTPMTGLEKAVWWIEYVIRNNGAKHLRNPTTDIPFYQYYLIDVISFLLLITATLFALLYVFVKLIYKYTMLYIGSYVDKSDPNSKKIK